MNYQVEFERIQLIQAMLRIRIRFLRIQIWIYELVNCGEQNASVRDFFVMLLCANNNKEEKIYLKMYQVLFS